MFSKRDLELLLEVKQGDFDYKVRNSSKGPGYHDDWLDINRRQNSWQHVELTTASFVKKVIFCEPLTGKVAADPFALMFTAALAKYFEVYLWYGPKRAVYDSRPLASVDEFWEYLPSATAATREEVLLSLAQQGCSADQFIIVDHAFYHRMQNRYLQDKMSLHVLRRPDRKKLERDDGTLLDLTQIVFQSVIDIASHLNVNDIVTLIAYAPTKEEMEGYLALFPKLETVIVKRADAGWLNRTLDTDYGVNIELRSFICKGELQIASNVYLAQGICEK